MKDLFRKKDRKPNKNDMEGVPGICWHPVPHLMTVHETMWGSKLLCKHFCSKLLGGVWHSSRVFEHKHEDMHSASRLFRYLFDLLILVNAILIGMHLDKAEWFFLTVFTLEILLKMYTFGFVRFIQQAWNV